MTNNRDVCRAALEAEQDPATIGHALARCRESRDWSREQLAEWLGLTPTGLAAIAVEKLPREAIVTRDGVRNAYAPAIARRWIGALARPYGADARRLAEALEVSIDG